MKLNLMKNPDGDFESVCLEWERLADNLAEMQRAGLHNIMINSELGWISGKPIDFLNENDWIEGVEIIGEDCDISPLNRLKKIRCLRLTSNKYKGNIDFKNLNFLEYLSIEWQKGAFINIDACLLLKFLEITKFPFGDLKLFGGFNALSVLKMHYSKLHSLNGIENCKKLKEIFIFSAPQLESINVPREVTFNIVRFLIEKCKRIVSYEILEEMLNLESLYLFEVSPIHSVDFLRKMKSLEYAYIGVDVLDKNVSYLKERGFEFKNRRLYK